MYADMINRQSTVHGGCTAFLVDVSVLFIYLRPSLLCPALRVAHACPPACDRCSSIGLAFLGMVQGRPSDFVSQSIVTTYHAPAPVYVLS